MNYMSKNVPPTFQKGGLRVTSNIFHIISSSKHFVNRKDRLVMNLKIRILNF